MEQLTRKFEQAKTDVDRVNALGELAEYYYVYRLDKKGDSVLQQQLTIAELSHNKNLVFATLFGKSVTNISPWSSIETFDQAMKFIQQGLDYASEAGRDDYVALAYIRKASLLRKRGRYENAIQQSTMAFSAIGNSRIDSVKAVLYLELGDIYKEMKNAVAAYTNFSNASTIAYDLKNILLQSKTYHHLAELYRSLGYKDLAKTNLLNSLEMNVSHGYKEGLLNDYIALAKLTDEKYYFDKSLKLADSLQSERHILLSKQIMFAYNMVVLKSSSLALGYLDKNNDLKQYYQNQGKGNFYFVLGNVYKYSGNLDSALYYYTLGEPEMNSSFDIAARRSIYKEMGECYAMMNNTGKAIEYFSKALELAKEIGEFSYLSSVTLQLSRLFAQSSEYKQAYDYNQQYHFYQDSLKKLTNDRSLVLQQVKKDEEKRQKAAKEQAEKHLRKVNLQYMGISIALAVLFLLMIVIGTFPISRFTIRALSFFAFICLFEFVIVMIDSYLHHATHGEPLKIWLAKIIIIAILLPLHHVMEHGLVKFLESRKLLEVREKLSIRKWWSNIKKSASKKEPDFEEDTAIL